MTASHFAETAEHVLLGLPDLLCVGRALALELHDTDCQLTRGLGPLVYMDKSKDPW